MPTAAEVKAALELHDQGVGPVEISGRLCVPIQEVRSLIAKYRPDAAVRDKAIASLLQAAASSGKQRTRSLGDRLRATYEELRTAVDEEAAQAADKERKEKARRETQDRINQLAAEIAELRKGMRAKAGAR